MQFKKNTTHEKVMKRIVEKSTQNVNSNAGIFLAKQILDRLPSFAKFDNDEVSRRSVANRIYSNSSIAKAEVALMTLGKTSFCDRVVGSWGVTRRAVACTRGVDWTCGASEKTHPSRNRINENRLNCRKRAFMPKDAT